MEPAGLIPGTDLRPADILTGALDNGLVALDIGIASPDAQGAGDDCLQTMLDKKLSKCEEQRPVLDRQNIIYRPMPFSCYGRLHSDTTAILRTLAKRIARRRGCSAGEWRFRRLKAKLITVIWARAARMVRACWPDGETDAEDEDESMPNLPSNN